MDDDSTSKGSSEETNTSRSVGKDDDDEQQDEVKGIRQLAAKETSRVRLWRFVVTGLLIATALSVTLATFYALSAEETERFEKASRQFSNTLANSARTQQTNIRLAYTNMADIISSSAYVNNATWPYYTFPRFEQLAYNILYQSRSELLFMAHLVKNESREQWLEFSQNNYEAWTDEAYMIESKRQGPQEHGKPNKEGYNPFITKAVLNGTEAILVEEEADKAEYWVSWTYSPAPVTYKMINFDVASVPEYDSIIQAAIQLKDETIFTRVKKLLTTPVAFTKAEHQAMHSPRLASDVEEVPHSVAFHPVHRDPDDDVSSDVVAVMVGGMAWDSALLEVLPDEATGMDVVITNDCNQSYTFRVDGPDAIYVGEGDHHDTTFDYLRLTVDLNMHDHQNESGVGGHCIYQMQIYPTAILKETWGTNDPEVFAIAIASTFALVIATFYVYDLFVQRRNEKLIRNAAKSSAIVSSLFPDTVRDKLMDQGIVVKTESPDNLHAFMSRKNGGPDFLSSLPMADLFLETTIMFADIVGFTAWSSVREPSQVFLLLETIYSGFDEIAKTRHVFKVETVGDCYVAATGVPHPRKDHAICMCRFARDVLKKMNVLTKKLEVTLGPETGDLDLRIGIHSGSITAGILRGEKARFQLFGDTMNTTARMESTGLPGHIQLSQETADILVLSGKSHWIEKRAELVQAKGKGQLQTYWLSVTLDRYDTSTSSGSSITGTDDAAIEAEDIDRSKTRRLVDWNVSSLLHILKHIVAVRTAIGKTASDADYESATTLEKRILESGLSFLDEVQDIITLPEFNEEMPAMDERVDDVHISPQVIEQLTDYVACIASMYRYNSFHNFEHASHVGMSVLKLLSRIVAPTESDHVDKSAADLHDHTYGITSDPLTQFACAFAAIIHDVDHLGVPNAQLVQEQAPVAVAYNNRSVAEQNSLTLAWSLLMDDRFGELRKVIYIDAVELARFRQLVVNAVMATDIADKDLKAQRNARWEKAFYGNERESHKRDAINRKATIVIEHLMQASDIAHTMQHWHIYRKWNEKFFEECYAAYVNGRATTDPSETWYRGEIGFFDFYIIPLAKKLKDCGVFGKSSDEYLSYAVKNREEWEIRGMDIVAEMKEKVMQEYGENVCL